MLILLQVLIEKHILVKLLKYSKKIVESLSDIDDPMNYDVSYPDTL